MEKGSDFTTDVVAYPLNTDEFIHFDTNTKNNLIRLMAKISESSYRRGYQHGNLRRKSAVDPYHLRYNVPIRFSPNTDGFDRKTGKWRMNDWTAIDRLDIEYGHVLRQIGFGYEWPKQ